MCCPTVQIGKPRNGSYAGVHEVEVAIHGGTASRTSVSTHVTSRPRRSASPAADSRADGEKSTPVTRAPARAKDSVSVPMRHWRWHTSKPETVPSGRNGASADKSVRMTPVRWSGSSKSLIAYAASCKGTRSSQLSRLLARADSQSTEIRLSPMVVESKPKSEAIAIYLHPIYSGPHSPGQHPKSDACRKIGVAIWATGDVLLAPVGGATTLSSSFQIAKAQISRKAPWTVPLSAGSAFDVRSSPTTGRPHWTPVAPRHGSSCRSGPRWEAAR